MRSILEYIVLVVVGLNQRQAARIFVVYIRFIGAFPLRQLDSQA
jgi:hypothetical protein